MKANSDLVSFHADKEIILLSGFTAEQNSDFQGKIIPIPCTPNSLNQSNNNPFSKNKSLNNTKEIPQLHIFPNPSSKGTVLKYLLPEDYIVTLQVFDNNGKIVSNLIQNEFKTRGEYQIFFPTKKYSNGIYSVIFQTEEHLLKLSLIHI